MSENEFGYYKELMKEIMGRKIVVTLGTILFDKEILSSVSIVQNSRMLF